MRLDTPLKFTNGVADARAEHRDLMLNKET